MFDTDGGGTIDRGELDFAMRALGFHAKHDHRVAFTGKSEEEINEAEAALEAITADGSVLYCAQFVWRGRKGWETWEGTGWGRGEIFGWRQLTMAYTMVCCTSGLALHMKTRAGGGRL